MNDALDEYLGLPEDPELGFVVYERRLRRAMWDSLSDTTPISYDHDRKIHYATKLMAFHDAHDFSFLKKPALSRGSGYFDERFDEFTDEVSYWTTQIEVRHAQRLRGISTILKLTPEIKTQLHSYISKIREAILPLNLVDKKKEAILGALNVLADEIDRDRTKTEAWTALALEIASAGGQAAKELKPVKDLSDSIGKLLGKAKEMAEDMLGLPAPTHRKRIEGPKQEMRAPSANEKGQWEDEIPF